MALELRRTEAGGAAPDRTDPHRRPQARPSREAGLETGLETGLDAGAEAGSGPGALANLAAARLVSHEAIGDPARLAGEAATLRALCRHVPGSIYRIAPFHYAFSVAAGADPQAQAAALQATLTAALGPEAIWIGAVELAAEAGGEAEALPEAALLTLRAHGTAVAEGLALAAPGLQAVIDARYATDCARRTAAAAPGEALDRRLAAIEAQLAGVAEALAVQAATGAALGQISDLLGTIAQHLDSQSGLLQARLAHDTRLVEQLDARGAAPAAFLETLGLTLAEFLARLERRDAEAAARPLPPQAG